MGKRKNQATEESQINLDDTLNETDVNEGLEIGPSKKRTNTHKSAFKTTPKQPRREWQPDEEVRFWEAIHAQIKWGDVSERLGTRNGDGCKKHWEAFLRKVKKEG
ncbi:hypothetical protein HK097_007551 [Rhizophlyctis rosea]|uniref:Myb-like domain-containing protein n=1 Tax=Rhizophlyctis rosea TaxID=64517 RepID=A0AAD5X5U4_9FUNG|nr:hypothetical protein HK097_007551 [Rhizophlyctis rosea]